MVDGTSGLGHSWPWSLPAKEMGSRPFTGRRGVGDVYHRLGSGRAPIQIRAKRSGTFRITSTPANEREFWLGPALHILLADQYWVCRTGAACDLRVRQYFSPGRRAS